MLRFKQFLIEGFVNKKNYAFSELPLSQKTNTNFWLSLYNPKDIADLTPEQKEYIQSITGTEQHSSTRLGTYQGENSAQKRLEKLRKQQQEILQKSTNWKPSMWDRVQPTPMDMQKEIEKLISSLETSKKNIQTGDSLFTRVTDRPMTVYRKVNPDPTTDWGKTFLDQINQNQVVKDTNFLSTSTNKKMISDWGFYPHAENSKILQIEVPVGTRYFVNPLSKAGKIDTNLGFELPKNLEGFGYAEDEILFPREIGLEIDPTSSETDIHQTKGLHAKDKPQNVKVHRAKIVNSDTNNPDRLMSEIDSQLDFLRQELDTEQKATNPKISGKDAAGKVATTLIDPTQPVVDATVAQAKKAVPKLGNIDILPASRSRIPGPRPVATSIGYGLAGLAGGLAGEYLVKPAAEKAGVFNSVEGGTREALSSMPPWAANIADVGLGVAQTVLDPISATAPLLQAGIDANAKREVDAAIKAGSPSQVRFRGPKF